VSQSPSTQVGINRPQVGLKRLLSGVDCLVIRFALNYWKYRVREACYEVLNGGILHLDVLGGPECLYVLLIGKRFWTGVPKKRECCLRAIALGSTVLVMTNELHLK
jgi:hypothetical protein